MSADRVTFADVLSQGPGGFLVDIEGEVYGPGVAAIDFDLQPGDTAPVGFLKPGSSRLPLILSQRPRLLEFPPALFNGSNTTKKDPGGIKVPVRAGIWLQTGGFWWADYASLFASQPLDPTVQTVTVTETFPDNGPITPTTLGGVAGVYVVLTRQPADVPTVNVTSVAVNGKPAPGLTVWTGANGFLGLTPIPNPPDIPTAPSSLTVVYTYTQVRTRQLSGGGPGFPTAFSPRGIVMFPSTSGPTQQMAGILLPIYAAQGGEAIVTSISDYLPLGVGSYSATLSQTPIPGSLDTNNTYFQGLDNLNIYYVPSLVGSALYALAVSWMYGDYAIHITYSYTSGTPVPLTETFTVSAPGPYTDTFTGDGNTTQFSLSNPLGSVVSLQNNNTDQVFGSDYTYDSGNIYFFYTPAVGDNIVVTYNGVVASPYTVTVANPITTMNDVLVNGAPDLAATYSGSVVTLAVTPNPGDTIQVDYTVLATLTANEEFVASQTPQTSFHLSHVPIPGTIGTEPGWGFNLNGNNLNLQPLISGQDVSFAIQIPDNTFAVASYNYNRIVGSLFNISGLVVSEWNLNASSSAQLQIPFAAPFDATPVSQFIAYLGAVSSAGGSHWQDGWNNQRWGFLFYDPVVDGYTAVGPDGLHWRSRTPGQTAGTHFTSLPWPDEDLSSDAKFTGYSYPANTSYYGWGPAGEINPIAPGLKRRTAPYMGVGVVSRYALQGSWGAVGPNIIYRAPRDYGGGAGCPSDTTFPIRFFRRDDKKAWQLVGTLTPFDLVQGNAGSHPLYIPGTGIIHQEGDGGFATGRPGNSPVNSWWPATKDASSWIIGCGWCESEWLRDISGLNTQANYRDYPMGATDAGYTLNAVDMAGTVTSQLTIKCDPDYEEQAYPDPGAQVTYALAHANDQFSYNPYYNFGGLNFGVLTDWVATELWGYLPNYGYCFFYYAMTSVDGAPKRPKLQMPGIPALADGDPRYSAGTDGQISSEDNMASQRIAGDGQDNFYFSLSIPIWCRQMDSAGTIRSETVSGVFTQDYNFTSGYDWIQFDCLGYQGVPIISAVRDKYYNQVYAPDFPTFGGKYSACYPISGYISIYQYTFDKQVTFAPPTSARNIFDEEGHYVGTAYTFDGELRVPWNHIIPNRSTCTLRQTYDWGESGVHFYAIPGYSEFPPFRGAAIYDVVGDNRRNYNVSARTFLFKVNCKAGKLSEVWRQDVSQQGNVFGTFGNIKSLPVSKFGKVYFTRPCGRFIFLLRILFVTAVVQGNPPPYDKVDLGYLALEAWTNTNPPVKQQTIYLPDKPDPLIYQNYKGAATNLQMHEGLDANNREWVYVTGTLNYGWGDPTHPQRWKIQFDTDPTVAPTVVYSDAVPANPEGPSIYNLQGMAEANSLYLWTEDDGSLKRKDGV